MNFKRLLAAALAVAVIALGSLCDLTAWADEDETPAVEEPKREEPEKSEPKEEKSEPKEEKSEPKEEKSDPEPKQQEPPKETEKAEETEKPKDTDPPTETEPPKEPEQPEDPVPEVTEPPVEDDPEPTPTSETDEPTPDETTPAPGEATPVPEIMPDDSTPTPEPTVEPTVEPTAEPGTASISIGEPGTVFVGDSLSLRVKAQNVESLTYRVTGPDGDTVASGNLSADTSSVSFTPRAAGQYTLVVSGIGPDGEEVSARRAIVVAELPALTLRVAADHECCHAGQDTSFTLTVPQGIEIVSCAIEATQSGTTFFTSSTFEEKISVDVPQSGKVTKVTLSVSVRDAYDRTANGSVTIPCAIDDRERRSEWEASMAGARLTGVWPDDLLAIAKTQVGYKESSKDFGEKHGGGISGYTRYGDWAGMRYDEWCAMFASFCLHYAGIDEEHFARASNCQRWIERLKKQDLYADRGDYEPKLGDLVFFEWQNDNDSDHVGIIHRLETDKSGSVTAIVTIEGNSTGGRVTDDDRYRINDRQIVGYGLVTLAYERYMGGTLETLPVEEEEEILEAEDAPALFIDNVAYDGDLAVTALSDLPEGTRLTLNAIEPGEAAFSAYAQRLRDVLGDDEPGSARFLEARLVDENGAVVEPQEPLKLSIECIGRLNASRALRPGVAMFDGAGNVELSADVDLTRGENVSRYEFELSRFDGVVGVYVAGKLKYKKDAIEATFGGVSAKLAYDPAAHIPAGSALAFREIDPDSDEYQKYAGELNVTADDLRLFEIGVALNGMPIAPKDSVTITLACGQPAGSGPSADGVSVYRVADGQSLPAKLNHRINGQTSVRFDTDGTGVFALAFTE